MKLVTNRREGTILYYRLADRDVTVLMKIALEHLHGSRQVAA
jgi:hypothetical protein